MDTTKGHLPYNKQNWYLGRCGIWNSQSFDRDIFMELSSNILKKLDLASETIERNKNILALSYLRLFQSFDESSRG